MANMDMALREAIASAAVNDVHEHIISSKTLAANPRGLAEFLGESYLHDDLVSAGAPDECFDPRLDSEQRWALLSPYLERVRNTTYYRCLIPALNELYGLNIDEIDGGNWRELDALLTKSAAEGASWYETVLREKGRIQHCLLDMDRSTDTEICLWKGKGLPSLKDTELEERFFERVQRVDLLFNIADESARREIAQLYGVYAASLSELDALLDSFCAKAKERRAVAYKCVAAYFRTIAFAPCSKESAARALERALKGAADEDCRETLQNYILRRLIERAQAQGLPFQFHTGMQALNANMIDNANPLHLNRLFLEYPGARFVMLHGGYPFFQEAGVLAKKFPNVYLDTSWLPQIGYAAAKQALSQWLDLVPMNKLTWGGDCRHVENSYAALILFKKLLAELLEEKIEVQGWTRSVAIGCAHRILSENAAEIYSL